MVQILAITEPESWSPHAVYQATRLFVSNLNAKMAQRFITLILLPSVRDDIQENRRLHFALFQAVKKSTYRPDAFFKVRRKSLQYKQIELVLFIQTSMRLGHNVDQVDTTWMLIIIIVSDCMPDFFVNFEASKSPWNFTGVVPQSAHRRNYSLNICLLIYSNEELWSLCTMNLCLL